MALIGLYELVDLLSEDVPAISLVLFFSILFCQCPGGGGPAAYFWQSQFYFLHCIECLKKIFLKLNFDFIVAEIRGVFGSVGVYACVSASV